MSSSIVTCYFCSKKFLKDNRHINENNKLRNNFYCSPDCESSAKKRQIKLKCDSPNCNNIFSRQKSYISPRNFCSRNCALQLIGPENARKRKKLRSCKYCKEIFTGKHALYCSNKCLTKARTISKEQLIKAVQATALKLGRTPTRREFKHEASCRNKFGSWNNALVQAGLVPHRSLNQRMYHRRRCRAKDGHICNSVSELIIDDWCFKNGIEHGKEIPYPTGKYLADWSLSENTLVEYFGLANDSKRYDNEIKKKRKICKEWNIKLIEIYSKDLFPKSRLDNIFNLRSSV